MCERGCEVRGRRAGSPVPDGTETNHRSEQEGIVQVLPSTFSSFVGLGALSCRSSWMRRPVLGCLSRVHGGGLFTLNPSSCPPSFAASNPVLSSQSITWWRKTCVREPRNNVNECIPIHMHPESRQRVTLSLSCSWLMRNLTLSSAITFPKSLTLNSLCLYPVQHSSFSLPQLHRSHYNLTPRWIISKFIRDK